MSQDDWCIEEERKYIFGSSCEVFMPPSLIVLHQHLKNDIDELFESIKCGHSVTAEDVKKIIDIRFGEQL